MPIERSDGSQIDPPEKTPPVKSDEATATSPSGTLSSEATTHLRAVGEIRDFRDGETVMTQGARGDAFCLVLEGQVETVLTDGSGTQLSLATGGSGHFFGEMSLLTAAPVSANVVARGPTRILACTGDRFHEALADCPALRQDILSELAARLRVGNARTLGLFQRVRAHAALMRLEQETGPLIQESRAMKKLVAQLPELGVPTTPLLIQGEEGVGKAQFARHVHEAGPNPEAPFVTADCRTLVPAESGQLLFGGVTFEGPGEPAGIGLLQLASRGVLVLRHVEQLDPECQRTLLRALKLAAADNEDAIARVVASTSADLAALAEAGRFDPALAELFLAHTVRVPSLAERRRDVIPLAQEFLARLREQTPTTIGQLTPGAEHELLRARWDYRNVTELREAIRFAAMFAGGDDIRREHIFTGPLADDAPIETSLSGPLLQFPRLRRALLALARIGTLGFFTVIILLCLTGSGPLAALANGLTWGVWWPSLLLLFIVVGRLWCTVCPLSTAAQCAKRLGTIGRAPPEWIKANSPWLLATLLTLIVWAEHVFHMVTHPFATGILLLSLMATAVVLAVIFERETWCRYLCPLGNLSAGFARGTMLQVHATPGICATKCQTHDCYKGREGRNGCPVFHHPLYVKDAPFCKLCLQCLDTCPHSSAQLYLRLPFHAIWRQRELGSSLLILSFTAALLSLLMLASVTWSATAQPITYTLAALTALLLGCGLARAVPRLFPNERISDPSFTSRLAVVILLFAWGTLMAFHLVNVPLLAGAELRLAAAPGWWPRALPTGLPLLPVCQLAAIVLGGLVAAVVLGRVSRHAARAAEDLSRPGWIAMLLALTAQGAASMALVIVRSLR